MNKNIITRLITSASAESIIMKGIGKCGVSHRLGWQCFRGLGLCILLSWLYMLHTKLALELLQNLGLPSHSIPSKVPV